MSLDAAEHVVEGDFTRIQQAVWNLLKNASKFTPGGGRIALASRNCGDRIEITVADSGMGIEPAVLPTIFNVFTQGGESVTREFGGLGLGLAITKATIEAHGGTVRADSAGSGKGATFTIELPLR